MIKLLKLKNAAMHWNYEHYPFKLHVKMQMSESDGSENT